MGYLLVWNPALYHAGGAGSSIVNKWLVSYHGLVTTGRDPLRGADCNVAASLWPANISESVRALYNSFPNFPSREADVAEPFCVVRDAA